MSIDGPFFPFPPSEVHYRYRTDYKSGNDGVSKREMFAAYFLAEALKMSPRGSSETLAKRAVERADALLRAL